MKLRKDPGVPSLFPFKERVLKEIEQSRQSLEQERIRRRDTARQGPGDAQRMEVEGSGMARLAQLASEQDETFEQEDDAMDDTVEIGEEEKSTKKDTSQKQYTKEFRKVIDQADVILYVLDARDPQSTRSKEVEQMIREAPSGEKQLVFVLNKIGDDRL